MFQPGAYLAEMKRRVQVLPDELAEWRRLVEANEDGFGLHRSQVQAVELMFAELIDFHDYLLSEMAESPSPQDFLQRRASLEIELSGAHGLLAVFRQILAQRERGSDFKDTLDLADLAAAECYTRIMDRAADLGVFDPALKRPPPLTFLSARPSPVAIKRSDPFKLLGFALLSYEEVEVPIPIISLRFHDAAALWSLGSLYHEVGHILDQDLGVGRELRGLVGEAFPGEAAATPRALWQLWTPEITADAFGVLLGGAGFAYTLADFLLQPPGEALKIFPGERHPPPYLRLALLSALLRQTGVPALAEAGDELDALRQAMYSHGAEALEPFCGQVDQIARLFLDDPLPQKLNHRSLHELAAGLDAFQEQAGALALALAGGEPVDAGDLSFGVAPAGARLAIQGSAPDYDERCRLVQERTLAFVQQIPRPEYMAFDDLPNETEEHLRAVARKIRFGTPVDEEEIEI